MKKLLPLTGEFASFDVVPLLRDMFSLWRFDVTSWDEAMLWYMSRTNNNESVIKRWLEDKKVFEIDSQEKKMLTGGVESCREVKKVLGFFSFCDVETWPGLEVGAVPRTAVLVTCTDRWGTVRTEQGQGPKGNWHKVHVPTYRCTTTCIDTGRKIRVWEQLGVGEFYSDWAQVQLTRPLLLYLLRVLNPSVLACTVFRKYGATVHEP